MAISAGTLSGWLLPDGTFLEAKEWWHLAALYDLRDAGEVLLCTPQAKIVLDGGDEDRIKEFVFQIGFVKLGRRLVEGAELSVGQLKTLHSLIEFFVPDEELGFILEGEENPRYMSVDRILKLKNPAGLKLRRD